MKKNKTSNRVNASLKSLFQKDKVMSIVHDREGLYNLMEEGKERGWNNY